MTQIASIIYYRKIHILFDLPNQIFQFPLFLNSLVPTSANQRKILKLILFISILLINYANRFVGGRRNFYTKTLTVVKKSKFMFGKKRSPENPQKIQNQIEFKPELTRTRQSEITSNPSTIRYIELLYIILLTFFFLNFRIDMQPLQNWQ